METLGVKAVAILVIFLVGYQGGLAAIRASKHSHSGLIFSLGSVFGGGVFLGASLIHVLPDSVAAFDLVYPHLEYPLAYMIVSLGFVLIMAVDRAGHYFLEGRVSLAHPRHEGDLAPYILLLVLSFHSILAGAALGAEGSFAGSLVLLMAILAHKGSAAFALSVSILKTPGMRGQAKRLIILFSFMSPLGILVGTGLDSFLHERSGRLVEGIFDALAAATFIYVATIEIIGTEFKNETSLLAKFACLVLGLAIMAVVALWL